MRLLALVWTLSFEHALAEEVAARVLPAADASLLQRAGYDDASRSSKRDARDGEPTLRHDGGDMAAQKAYGADIKDNTYAGNVHLIGDPNRPYFKAPYTFFDPNEGSRAENGKTAQKIALQKFWRWLHVPPDENSAGGPKGDNIKLKNDYGLKTRKFWAKDLKAEKAVNASVAALGLNASAESLAADGLNQDVKPMDGYEKFVKTKLAQQPYLEDMLGKVKSFGRQFRRAVDENMKIYPAGEGHDQVHAESGAHDAESGTGGLGNTVGETRANPYFEPLEAPVDDPGFLMNMAKWQTEKATIDTAMTVDVATALMHPKVGQEASWSLGNVTEDHALLRENVSNYTTLKKNELELMWEPIERDTLTKKQEAETALHAMVETLESDVYTVDESLESTEIKLRTALNAQRQSMSQTWNSQNVLSAKEKNDLDESFQKSQAHETALLKAVEEYRFFLDKEKHVMLQETEATLDDFTGKIMASKKRLNTYYNEMVSAEQTANRRFDKQATKQWQIKDNDKDRTFIGANEERKIEEASLLSKLDEERMAAQRLLGRAEKADSRRHDLAEVGGGFIASADAEALALQDSTKAKYAADKRTMHQGLEAIKDQMLAESEAIEMKTKDQETQENEEFRLKSRDATKNMESTADEWHEIHSDERGNFAREMEEADAAKEAQRAQLTELTNNLKAVDDRFEGMNETLKAMALRQRSITSANVDTAITHDAKASMSEYEIRANDKFDAYKDDAERAITKAAATSEDTANLINRTGFKGLDDVEKRIYASAHVADYAVVAEDVDKAARGLTTATEVEVPAVENSLKAMRAPLHDLGHQYEIQYTGIGKNLEQEIKTDSTKALTDFKADLHEYAGESDEPDSLAKRTQVVFDQADANYKKATGALEVTDARVHKAEKEQAPRIRGAENTLDDDKTKVAEEFDEYGRRMVHLNTGVADVEQALNSMALEPIKKAGEKYAHAATTEFAPIGGRYTDSVDTEVGAATDKLEGLERADVTAGAAKGDELRKNVETVKADLSHVSGVLMAMTNHADASKLGDSSMAQKLYSQYDRINTKFTELEQKEADQLAATRAAADAEEDKADAEVDNMFNVARQPPAHDPDAVYKQAMALAIQEAASAADTVDLSDADAAAAASLAKATDLKDRAAQKVEEMEAADAAEKARLDADAAQAAQDASQTQANDGQVATVGSLATKEIGDGLSDFEKVHRALELQRAGVEQMERKVEDRWQAGKEAASQRASQHLHDANGPQTKKLLQEVEANAVREKQSSETFAEGRTELQHQLTANRDEVETLKSRVQSGLAAETEALGENSKAVEDATGNRAIAFTSELNKRAAALADLVGVTEEEHAKEKVSWDRYAKLSEQALQSAGAHEMADAQMLETEMRALDLTHSSNDRAVNMYRDKDLAWKHIVVAKLKSMGVKMNTEGLDMVAAAKKEHQEVLGYNEKLKGALHDEVAGEHSQLQRDLARLYIQKDADIKAIMDDESLSEEERKQMLAEVERQASEDAANLHKKASDRQMAEKALEQELGKYQAMVDAAAAATARAIANGNLSPSAAHVQANLARVGKEVLKLKAKPWLAALAQVDSHEAAGHAAGHAVAMKKVLADSNDQLSHANGALQQEIEALQRKIERLER